ncbi:MAG: hypothetical protein J7K40_07755 [candidate division Zixibacteria bacterium]|nr:hypothetical protein [candidate division Zixibacteria bacterium]
MSKKIIVPYVNEESNVFRMIKRPKLSMSIYSKQFEQWIYVEDVLADTGADISVLPESMGILMVGDYRKGERFKITGLLPQNIANMYIHKLSIRIGSKVFRTRFAISNSNDIPPTLGRVGGLDKFDIQYKRGKTMVIRF